MPGILVNYTSYFPPKQLKLQVLPENAKEGATLNAAAPANTGNLRQDVVELRGILIPSGVRSL